ncbi:Cytochrome P450 [Cinnamomum micranthum f. kanehirae]|uniref:Cytochrome P450 n=1 Tax=Cinnamomum micranthum f. kanehirae TaxID=337451 RepID=A0A443N2U4_9MAGN|nr:Cytochrome P450 [Cinnamomum micranthum f. kanehirae]
MDFYSPSFPLTFAFLLFLFMVFKKGKKDKAKAPVSNLPPGPWKLPIIGNMHQLLGPLPHHTLRDLARKHGPLMHLKLGEVSTIVISSSKFAMEVMKTHDLSFADRPKLLPAKIITYNCTNIAFCSYGSYWRQLRKICTLELLSAKRVESFSSIREEEVSNFIQSIWNAANSPVDLSEKLFSLNNNIIARAAFGKKCKDKERFISAMRDTLKVLGGFSIADCFPSSRLVEAASGLRFQCERVRHELDLIFDDIIEDHKQRSIRREGSEVGDVEETDFIDVLLSLQQQGGLEFPITTDNLKGIILDIFTGGTESTSSVVEWAMSELMRNPRAMEKAQAEARQVFSGKTKDGRDTNELSYLKSVLKETLRLHAPVPLLVPRECRKRCEIGGYRIPEKTRVLINAWAIGRDPQQWDDAESFKPERFDESTIDFKGAHFELIPFGAGRRICPGVTFGVTNSMVPLAELLYYFDWKLPNNMEPKDLDMTENSGITARRRSNLFLVPIPHIPLPVKMVSTI